MRNEIQLVIKDADLTQLNDLTTQIEGIVKKYVKPLSSDDREGGLKLGDRSVAFVEKVIEYALLNPTRVPEGVDLEEVKRDYAVLKAFGPLVKRLFALYYDLESTVLLAGADVMDAALKMYAQNQLHAKTGVPGAQAAVLDQQERFPGRGKAKQAE